MKLERYKDKKETRKKVILIGLTVITLVSITMMLYKTFAKFTTSTSFTIMSGQVKYKKKGKQFGTDIPEVQDGDGLYKVEHSEASNGWDKAEYRYGGKNVNNYVYFNCSNINNQTDSTCEKWRIIGLVNVKTSKGIEQRIKIVRNESIGWFSWDYQDGNKENDWIQASLMGLLNDTYYNSLNENTYCYRGSAGNSIPCDFLNGVPKGLTSLAREMIEKEISWNLGGISTTEINTKSIYEAERGLASYPGRQVEWTVGNTRDPKTGQLNSNLFRGIGLMYPSDYGYAVGGDVRNNCLERILGNLSYSSCAEYNWLFINLQKQWLLTIYSNNASLAVGIAESGFVGGSTVDGNYVVRPTVFLSSKVAIGEGSGSETNPYHLVM